MKATRESFGTHLANLVQPNDDVFVLDADLGPATKSNIFRDKYPDKWTNVGIAEQNMVAMAAGMSKLDYKVFVSSFAIFSSSRAHEIIRNSVCYPQIPITIVASHLGFNAGYDGGSHQSIEDVSIMRCLPNINIITPVDENEMQAALKYILENDKTFYLRLDRTPVNNITPIQEFKLGEPQTLKVGSQAILFSYGSILHSCYQVITDNKLDISIINLSTLKPLNEQLILKLIVGFDKVIVVEEQTKIGAMGEAIAKILLENQIQTRFMHLGIDDKFGETATPEQLLQKHNLDPISLQKKFIEFITD